MTDPNPSATSVETPAAAASGVTLDLADLQSGLLHPRPSPYAGAYLLFRVDDAADGRAVLGRLAAVIARHDPRTVIALGDSFHDREAHHRLSEPDRGAIAAMQTGRDWIWIAGNHDPALPSSLGGIVASEVCIGPIAFRHEPSGAVGEIAGHLHPKARVPTRGRATERRCFACDGERAIMPAFGAYAGGLSVRDKAFTRIFGAPDFIAHVLGDNRLHAIIASRCF